MGLCTTSCVRVLQILKDNGIKNKSLCMIGRQNINVELSSFMKIVNRMGIEYDQEIYQENMNTPIDTYQFFRMFGIKEVHAVDLNPEDGADIIFDLNNQLPEDMIGKYDYVLNCGTLEHIFDVAKAFSNISAMVKRGGGIVVHCVPLTGYVDHGFYSFSPTFFIDYYNVNDFEVRNIDIDFRLDKAIQPEWMSIYSQDCRIFDDWVKSQGKINDYIKKICAISDIGTSLLWCVAQRKENIDMVYPLQGMYSTIYKEQKVEKEKIKVSSKMNMKKVLDFLRDNIEKDISCFCAGDICGRLVNELYKNDLEECIKRIFDNDISKVGEQYRGYKVVYPTKKRLNKTDIILICSDKYEDEVKSLLLQKGVSGEIIYPITDIN